MKRSITLLAILAFILVLVAYTTEDETATLTPGEIDAMALEYINSKYNSPSDIIMGNSTNYQNFAGKEDVTVIPVQFNYDPKRIEVEKKAIDEDMKQSLLTGLAVLDKLDSNKQLKRADCITVSGQLIITKDQKIIPMAYHEACE